MTEPFQRTTSRSFGVAPDFAVIVAICGTGAQLREHFKTERDAGRIVIILTESVDPKIVQANANIIALADEVLFLLDGDGWNDFEATIFFGAKELDKHIRVIEREK